MSPGRTFTLILEDGGGTLLDPEGNVRTPLWAPMPEGEAPGTHLRRALPPRARVQVVLADAGLRVLCQAVPRMNRRERREAARRLLRDATGPGWMSAEGLEPDTAARGGHVLWLAAHPAGSLRAWLEALGDSGARAVRVVPWQRALAAAAPPKHPAALHVALRESCGHFLLFQGRALLFERKFHLPPGEHRVERVTKALGDELPRLLHFLAQKLPGAAPESFLVVGAPPEASDFLEGLAWEEGLPFTSMGSDLPAVLARGAAQGSGHLLDLLPPDVRRAHQRAWFRAVVRIAAAGMLLLGGSARIALARQERFLALEAQRAEAECARSQAEAQAGEEAARQRAAYLRVRGAEARQAQAVERMERLGEAVFRIPRGMALQEVEIAQAPGNTLEDAFRIEAAARTGRAFSLGLAARYVAGLSSTRGVALSPLKDVVVTDAPEGNILSAHPLQGITRFRVEGRAR